MPDPETKECVLDQSAYCRSLYDPTLPPTNCPRGTTYLGSPKYRRVAASKCVNDIAAYLEPRVVPCPEEPIVVPSPVRLNGTGPRIVRDNVPRTPQYHANPNLTYGLCLNETQRAYSSPPSNHTLQAALALDSLPLS